jgi:biotin carboxyl carrier protein
VWKIQVEVGSQVAEGDTVMIFESMKMEMPLESPATGRVTEIRCSEGDAVQEGVTVLVLEP